MWVMRKKRKEREMKGKKVGVGKREKWNVIQLQNRKGRREKERADSFVNVMPCLLGIKEDA